MNMFDEGDAAAAALLAVSQNEPARLNALCEWIPGDAIPACDFDPRCSVHGTATALCPDHGTPTCAKDSDCQRLMGDE